MPSKAHLDEMEFMQTDGEEVSERSNLLTCRLGNALSFDNRDSAARTIEEHW
jgi:hypothetical protein